MGVTRTKSRELGGGARVRPAFSRGKQLGLALTLEVKPDARRAETRKLDEDLTRHYGASYAVR